MESKHLHRGEQWCFWGRLKLFFHKSELLVISKEAESGKGEEQVQLEFFFFFLLLQKNQKVASNDQFRVQIVMHF